MMKAIGGSARGILNLFLTKPHFSVSPVASLELPPESLSLSLRQGCLRHRRSATPHRVSYFRGSYRHRRYVGAYPLRRLANVRPATIFRGDA